MDELIVCVNKTHLYAGDEDEQKLTRGRGGGIIIYPFFTSPLAPTKAPLHNASPTPLFALLVPSHGQWHTHAQTQRRRLGAGMPKDGRG